MQRSRKLRWKAEPGSILYRYRRRNILLGILFAAGVVSMGLAFLLVEFETVDPSSVNERVEAAASFGATRGPATIHGTVDRRKYPDATLVVVRDVGYEPPDPELPVEIRMMNKLEDFAASPGGAIASDGRYRVSEIPSGPVTIELWQSVGAEAPIDAREVVLVKGEESLQDFP